MNRVASAVALALMVTLSTGQSAPGTAPQPHRAVETAVGTQDAAARAPSLGGLSVWGDGLAEIAYYRATDRVGGQACSYTRVHLLNRQWMDAGRGQKSEPPAEDSIPVLKLVIAEEIPTDTFDHRNHTTLFVQRDTLRPFKMVASTQEWCGTTFQHLRWAQDGVQLKSFSYHHGEGDRVWGIDSDAFPFEALLLIARDVAATATPRELEILRPIRSSGPVVPTATTATIVPRPPTRVIVGAGTFWARRIDLVWEGQLAGFVVEAGAPYRLLRFRFGQLRAELVHIERRAFWDARSPSMFYEPGHAP